MMLQRTVPPILGLILAAFRRERLWPMLLSTSLKDARMPHACAHVLLKLRDLFDAMEVEEENQ